MAICTVCQIPTCVTIEVYTDSRTGMAVNAPNACFPCREKKGASHLKPLVFVVNAKEDPEGSPFPLYDDTRRLRC